MMQLSFLDPEPRARRLDPETSHQAARAAKALAAEHDRLIVTWLQSHPEGGNKDEISLGLNGRLDPTQVCRRFAGLEESGQIVRTDITRPTKSGRAAVVWKSAALPDGHASHDGGGREP